MTDARLPERLLMDIRVSRLPADAWRSYTHSLMWAVSNRTEGFIQPEDLPMIPMFRAGDQDALTRSGLWIEWGRGWWIDRFDVDQTTKAQLESAERNRANDRDRKARQRLREKQAETTTDHGVTRDVTGDSPGQDRTGKARTGSEVQTVEEVDDRDDKFGPSSMQVGAPSADEDPVIASFWRGVEEAAS